MSHFKFEAAQFSPSAGPLYAGAARMAVLMARRNPSFQQTAPGGR